MNGQDRHRAKESYKENVKERDRNLLSCRESSGGKITRNGRNLGCHISVLQNACSPQMFRSNINKMPNKPLCSSLRLQLPLHNAETGSVCLSSLQESVPDNIKKLRTG